MRGEGPTPGVFPPPESLRPTVFGSRYMVSAGHPLVAQVAARVFDEGGNAVDAGVAAGVAANVVQVDMCNFGGVAPILVRPSGSDRVWSVAGLGTWGRDVSIEAFHERFRNEMPLGAPVALVPAAPAAWITTLKEFGTWSFADAAAPAIELAGEGFVLDFRTAAALQIEGRGFRRWKGSRAVYWPKGRAPRAGERLRQPDLAALLERLTAAERAKTRTGGLEAAHREFYEGEVAERIVGFVRAQGGWLTREDLAEFESEVAPAVSRRYGNWEVFVTDTWTQGPALLQTLAILEGFALEAFAHNSADYIHIIAEAIKLAFSDRERYYGDPRFVDVDLEWLLSDEHAKELRARISGDSILPNLPSIDEVPSRRFDTTYLCTVDAEGNAFSATPSDTLDGGPIVPGLGIVVSPRGVQSRLDPDHPSALAGGKRPRLTPAPALALSAGQPSDRLVWPFGCPGGDVILQAMLQAFLNLVHFGMTPQQSVEAPRFACFSFPDSFYPHAEMIGRVTVEARMGEGVRAELAARGHDVRVWPDYEFDAGAVSMALDLASPSLAGRVLAGAADPRRICYAIGR